MNKNINKSCRYCITAFAAVTDRKLSLQGSVISWKWGVSGMLVIWDHVFSNSTSFSIVCSENCSCPCTPQVGAEGLIQGQRSLQTPPAPPWWVGIKLCHCSGSLWGSWTPPEAVETRGQAWPEQKGWPWKAEHFHLLKIWLWKDLDVCQLPFNLQCGWVMGTTTKSSYLFSAWEEGLKGELWVREEFPSLGSGRHHFHWPKLSHCMEHQIWDQKESIHRGTGLCSLLVKAEGSSHI